MVVELTDDFIKILMEKAKRKTLTDNPDDDFNPYDRYGGNMDDAYFGGTDDGETEMARQVLDDVGINWTRNDD